MQTAFLIIISIIAAVSFGLAFLYFFAQLHQSMFGRTSFNDELEIWVLATVDRILHFFRLY